MARGKAQKKNAGSVLKTDRTATNNMQQSALTSASRFKRTREFPFTEKFEGNHSSVYLKRDSKETELWASDQTYGDSVSLKLSKEETTKLYTGLVGFFEHFRQAGSNSMLDIAICTGPTAKDKKSVEVKESINLHNGDPEIHLTFRSGSSYDKDAMIRLSPKRAEELAGLLHQ